MKAPLAKLDDAARAQAAHWMVLHQSGEMSEADEQKFFAWIEASPENQSAFEKMQRGWAASRLVAQEPEILAMRKKVQSRYTKGRYKNMVGLAATIALFVVPSVVALEKYLEPAPDSSSAPQAFLTQLGQRADITLADGSAVKLDSETNMVARNLPTSRNVVLKSGRAYFDVAKNPDRPFTVIANGKAIRALGTAFSVSIDGNDVVVTLVEGKVRVTDVGGTETSVEMTPGRQLIARKNQNWTMKSVDSSKEESWTIGKLTYMRDPLSKAVYDMNRYSKKKIIFENGRVPQKNIIGVFDAGDVDSFVTAIELNDIAKTVETRDDAIILRENFH
ncbi:hypothetical protein DMP17_01835 [Pseudonocardia sp. TMWB2A]|uniref:FecR family protein n=1 Tax=Pseudonocardia sp. TMWB2A TaxID=687430 RepID=UPI00307F5EDA